MEKALTEQQQRLIRFYHSHPFIRCMNFEVLPQEDGTVRFALPIDEMHTNLYGIAHGGVLMAMADTVMGAACLELNKKVVTMNLSMDFMHAVPMTQRIVATAQVLHDGRHTMTCECEILSEEGKLFAKAHAMFYVLGKFIEDDME